MSIKPDYDIIINGGGLAGLTLACLLGQAGIKTACVDMTSFTPEKSDLRTTAISYGSHLVLKKANIWDDVLPKSCPINDIHILDGDSALLLQFDYTEVENKSFGWIVENHDLKTILHERIKSLPSVDYIAPQKLTDIDVQPTHVTASFDNGSPLTAKLLIGADGRRSFTRKWMIARNLTRLRGWSYNQNAVICNIAHENPHQNIAVEHFFADGPFAVLPMQDDEDGTHRSSVVFTEHRPRRGQSLMDLSDDAFTAKLNALAQDFYGEIHMISARQSYPLSLGHASSYVSPRICLISDAAHGIHPIAGQGLNLGFRDIDLLSDMLPDTADPGDIAFLMAYERKRRPDIIAMIAFTDGINRLFSNRSKTIGTIRRFGLKAVARLSPAKQFFMHRAMGEK